MPHSYQDRSHSACASKKNGHGRKIHKHRRQPSALSGRGGRIFHQSLSFTNGWKTLTVRPEMNISALVPDEECRRELNDMFKKILNDIAPDQVPTLDQIPELNLGSPKAESQPTVRTSRARQRGVIEAGVVLHL